MRRSGWLLATLLVVLPPVAAEETNPRLTEYRAELRRAIPKLTSDDPDVRLRALKVVQHKLNWVGSHLLELDPDEDAAMATGTLDEALARLERSTTDKHGRSALDVIELLAGHTPETRRVLVGRLDEIDALFDRVDERGLENLLTALSLLGASADALTPRIVGVLEGDERTDSRHAGAVLGAIGGPRARAALAEAFAHERIEVRRHAVRGWRFLDVVSPDEIRPLLAAFEDPEVAEAARRSVLHLTGEIDGSPEEIRAFLGELADRQLVSTDARERRAALTLVRKLGLAAKGHRDLVRAILENDPDPNTRVAAAEALRKVDPGYTTARAIMDAIEAPANTDERRALIQVLGAGYARPLLPRLEAIVANAGDSYDDQSLVYHTERLIRWIERTRIEWTPRTRFEAGDDRVRYLAWSPTGDRVVAGCADRTLRIWEPDNPNPVAHHVLPRYG